MKKRIVLIVVALALLISFSVSGLTYMWATTRSTLFVNEVHAHFTPAWDIVSNDFGATVGENCKRCYVRLIEGNYDSGRVYSATSTDITEWTMYDADTSRINNPFKVAYGYWGWFYF